MGPFTQDLKELSTFQGTLKMFMVRGEKSNMCCNGRRFEDNTRNCLPCERFIPLTNQFDLFIKSNLKKMKHNVLLHAVRKDSTM